MYEAGEGNSETQMTEEQFDEWKLNLWSKLCEYYASINTSKSVAVKKKEQNKDQLPLRIEFDITKYKDGDKTYEMAAR